MILFFSFFSGQKFQSSLADEATRQKQLFKRKNFDTHL